MYHYNGHQTGSYDNGAARPISISGSTYTVPVTGITREGPASNQTGTNLFNTNTHGWISVDEPLGAGQRFVMDNAFLIDLVSAMTDSSVVFIGLKDTGWNSAYKTNNIAIAMEGGAYFQINRNSASDVQIRATINAAVNPGSNAIFSSLAAISTFNIELALEITGSGDNIRLMMATSANNSENDITSLAYADWNGYKQQTGDQGFGLSTVDVMFLGDGALNTAAAVDADDVDWTALSEVSVPAPAPAITTNWTKALDFSGSSERAQQVDSGNSFAPIKMGGITRSVPQHNTEGSAYTSNDSYSRPWACAIVFSSDNHNSNQHIWNLGEGAGDTDDNIYLRVAANRELYFGWGRTGALNECYLGTLSSGSGNWYGIYIAHTGARFSGTNATATNLADSFDIYSVNLSTGAIGTNISTSSNWQTTGGRMDRQVAGDMTIGGRGTNRSFHGKVASMVVTTLRRGQQMPQSAEISMMVRDPQQWMTDYKVGVNYRPPASSQANSNWQRNVADPAYSTQVWLMGDGTNDAYSQIRNNVYPAIQNYYPLNMLSMVSNDIVTVNIPGLS